jgi:hypothetical protein
MTEDIRRRSDGSIDSVQIRIAARRDQAKREATALRAVGALVMAGAIGFALVVPSGSDRPHDNAVAPQSDSFQVR